MRHLSIGIMTLLLLGCAAPQTTQEPTVAETSVAVVEPTATVTAEPLPTRTPIIIPTRTPLPTLSAEQCMGNVEWGMDPQAPPPDLSDLEWERGTQGERRLTGFNTVPRDIQLSPDGTQIAATFYLGSSGQLGIAATAVLDTQGDEHRLLGQGMRGWDRFYKWLPNGRLLWLDGEGQVWLDEVNLNAPVPMVSIEGLQWNIAYLQGQDGSSPDWRVNLASRRWEEIISADGYVPATLEGFSADGSYALYTATHDVEPAPGISVWRVPTGMGSPPQYLFSFETAYIGTDAYFGPPHAENLRGTGVWVVHDPFAYEDDTRGYRHDSIVLDINAKKRITAEDLGLDPDYLILSASIEDGQWLTVELTDNLRIDENSRTVAVDAYYTSRYRLTGGTLSDEPPAQWINPLPEGAMVLGSNIGTNWRDGSYTRDRTFVLVRLPSVTIELVRYDGIGQLIDALNLERDFAPGWWGAVFDMDALTLYFPAAKTTLDEDGECQIEGMLMAWELVEAPR